MILSSSNATQERSRAIGEQPFFKELLPLTAHQHSIWTECKYEPFRGNRDILSLGVKLNGLFDFNALKETLLFLVKKHPALRSKFILEGNDLFQKITPLADFSFVNNTIDVKGKSTKEIYELAIQNVRNCFQLLDHALFRTTSLVQNAAEAIIVFSAHRLILDKYSLKILMIEFQEMYPQFLAKRRVIFKEDKYEQYLKINAITNVKIYPSSIPATCISTFIKDQLVIHTNMEEEPMSHERYTFRIANEMTHKLKEIADQRGATLYMLMLTAFQIALFLETEVEEISIISPQSRRNKPEIASFVGTLNNDLKITSSIKDAFTLIEMIRSTRQEVMNEAGKIKNKSPLYCTSYQISEPNSDMESMIKFIWESETNLANDHDITVFIDPENNTEEITCQFEPYYIPQEVPELLLNLKVKRDKEDNLFGYFEYNPIKISEERIGRIYLKFYKLLFSFINEPSITIKDLKKEGNKISFFDETKKSKMTALSTIDNLTNSENIAI